MAGRGVVVGTGEGVVMEAKNFKNCDCDVSGTYMYNIHKLTRSQVCGNMCRAADNRQEPTCSPKVIRAELHSDGAGAGEGAGDGGAAVALGGHTVIDLDIVVAIVSYR